jgi:hypothetical protein
MLRQWLDRLIGRSSDAEGDAEKARAEAAIERRRLDRAGNRVMGVGGDYGGTVPEAHTTEDRRRYD